MQVKSANAQLAVGLARTLPLMFNRAYAAQQAAQYAEIQTGLTQEIALEQVQLAQTQAQIATLDKPRDAAEAAELERLQSEQTNLLQNLTDLTLANAKVA